MKRFFSDLKKTWKYAKKEKIKIVIYIINSILFAGLGVIIPLLSAKLITALTNNLIKQLLLMGIAIFITRIIQLILFTINSWCANKIYRETMNNLQIDLGKETLKLDNVSLDSNSSGIFIQRLTSDTDQLSSIFNQIVNPFLKCYHIIS